MFESLCCTAMKHVMLEEITGLISRLDRINSLYRLFLLLPPYESCNKEPSPYSEKKKSYQIPALWVFYLKKAIQWYFLREWGQKWNDQQITPGFRPSLWARKRGRDSVKGNCLGSTDPVIPPQEFQTWWQHSSPPVSREYRLRRGIVQESFARG